MGKRVNALQEPGQALRSLLTHDERGNKRDWYLVACGVACHLQGHIVPVTRIYPAMHAHGQPVNSRTKNGRTWFLCSRCEEWIPDV